MIISMLYVMENGATAEIGVVGNDGLIGNALYGRRHDDEPGDNSKRGQCF